MFKKKTKLIRKKVFAHHRLLALVFCSKAVVSNYNFGKKDLAFLQYCGLILACSSWEIVFKSMTFKSGVWVDHTRSVCMFQFLTCPSTLVHLWFLRWCVIPQFICKEEQLIIIMLPPSYFTVRIVFLGLNAQPFFLQTSWIIAKDFYLCCVWPEYIAPKDFWFV